MHTGLAGRSVLITGGSKGIGLACAQAFLAEGAKVAIVSRERANLDAAAATLLRAGFTEKSVATIQANLVQRDAAVAMLRAAQAAIGPIDVLVNSAGAAKRYLPEELNAARLACGDGCQVFHLRSMPWMRYCPPWPNVEAVW